MSDRFPRWKVAIVWIAILAPVPYGVSRLLWAAGIPLGIDEAFLRRLESPGWGSLGLVALALLSEGTAVFTRIFLLPPRAGVVPAWVPVAGGRRVHPWLVIAPLLAPIAILALANAFTVGLVLDDGFAMPADNEGLPAWSFWGQLAVFWVWGASLTTATFLYWHSTLRRGAGPAPHGERGERRVGDRGGKTRRRPPAGYRSGPPRAPSAARGTSTRASAS